MKYTDWLRELDMCAIQIMDLKRNPIEERIQAYYNGSDSSSFHYISLTILFTVSILPKLSSLVNFEHRKRQKKRSEELEEAMDVDVENPSLDNDASNFISINGTDIQAVQALPDIDEDLLFEAFDFLEKGKNATIFIAMEAKLRSKWLRKKLLPKPMEILVKTQDGKTVTSNVFTFTTIKELKAKLQEKEPYLPSKILLIYGGKQLVDARRSISD
ncbi:unnamed protein product [Citrullus colocynthis]|uniref:Ubiquitin-like domain-containing protein n=1 Tax=Citrullus colocynthis TaxID=252529 RepID=A0ABP0YNA3_9ROSI